MRRPLAGVLLLLSAATTRRVAPARLSLTGQRPAMTPRQDVLELLEDFSLLQFDGKSMHSQQPLRPAAATQPSELSTELSTDRVVRTAKKILASPDPTDSRQLALANLCEVALAAGRLQSARLVYELAERRLSKWRTTSESTLASRRLVRVGLLVMLALRDRVGYERTLSLVQDEWDVELAEEPTLLSAVMVGCCEADWVHHASAINMTLAAVGVEPTTDALNALMAMHLRASEHDRVIDTFVRMKRHGPQPDRASHALVTAAAATRKDSWKGLRNLMRRSWLKIPWNAHSANAALAAYVRVGNLGAAAGVAAQMGDRTPLRLEALEGLLAFASVTCRSTPTTLKLYEAIQSQLEQSDEESGGEEKAPLSSETLLLVLPHLPPHERTPFVQQALARGGFSHGADEVRLQGTLALLAASEGRGAEAGAWLCALHAEGVDLTQVDSVDS